MPNFYLKIYLFETVGHKRYLTKLNKLHHGSHTQLKGYFFYLPDQFSWILLCNNNPGNDVGAKEPAAKMESVISSPSRPKHPLVRCQFSGGKYPHFSGLACISNPFSFPTLWLSKPLSPQCSLHDPACANTTSEPPGPVLLEAQCWAMEKAAQEQLFGEGLPCSAPPGHLELCTEGENCLLGGNSEELVPCSHPSSSVMADHSRLFLMDQVARDPWRCLVPPLKKPCTNQLFPHSMLLHALLNPVEDTGWLDPKRVNAIYDLAEEITSVFHVLLALAWKEPEIEKTHWTGQWEHWKLQQSKRKMASTNSSRELEVREDKKLHVHLWCAVAQRKIPVHFYGVNTPIVLSRTDTKYYEQKEPDYSIFLGIAALWTNREKLKEAKLLMGLPDA